MVRLAKAVARAHATLMLMIVTIPIAHPYKGAGRILGSSIWLKVKSSCELSVSYKLATKATSCPGVHSQEQEQSASRASGTNELVKMDSSTDTSNNHHYCKCSISRQAAAKMSNGHQRWNVRNLLVATLFVSLFIALLNPNPHPQQLAEGAKLKKEAKKLIKSLAKGFVVSKLSTRKNFMPLPVPIPVPIELSEPPVYLKGKPKYVNVYKATTPAVVKPTTVYHMPVYSPTYQEYSTSMMDPMSLYGPMMAGGSKAYGMSGGHMKHSLGGGDSAVESALNSANFNDFDDDSSNYYIRKVAHPMSAASKRKQMAAFAYGQDEFSSRLDESAKAASSVVDEQESIDEVDASGKGAHVRVKRQIYMSSQEEGPCHGFPLEINVKSRVKLDRIFPIHGKSQFRKCVKPVKLPSLLPPPPEDPYHRHPYK